MEHAKKKQRREKQVLDMVTHVIYRSGNSVVINTMLGRHKGNIDDLGCGSARRFIGAMFEYICATVCC